MSVIVLCSISGGVTVLALIYGGLGGTPRQGRQELGRSDAYCITCRPSCWEIMFQFVRIATFFKQVVRTASPGCSCLNKPFGKDISVREMFENKVRSTEVNPHRSLFRKDYISLACLVFLFACGKVITWLTDNWRPG